MKVNITRIDSSLPLPEYKTSGAVAFDLYSRIDATLEPQAPTLLPTNLIIQVPEGYALIIASRSGLSKRGLRMSNGIGIIDQDFHGPEDELQMLVYNFTSEPVQITKGERLGQGILVATPKVEWQEVEPQKADSRGGFGSTGTN